MIKRIKGGSFVTGFDWLQASQKQWDERALFWSERSKNMWDNGSRKKIIPFINQHLNAGDHVLDIGCGDGYGTHKLHQAGYKVTGMDISSNMIAFAQERWNENGLLFKQGAVESLSQSPTKFQAIMAINVLEWTEIPADAIKQIKNHLETDGLFFAGILGPTAGPRANGYSRLYGEKTIANSMMPWEFLQLAQELGFTYNDGFGVYKKGVNDNHLEGLPLELKQALSFMWVFCLKKGGE